MPLTRFAGLRYPSELDADNVPAFMQQLAEDADTCVVLRADSDADRTLTLIDAPAGVLCVYPNGTTTVKTGGAGDDTWQDLWRPVEAWKALPFKAGYKNWDTSDPCQYRKDRDGRVWLRGWFTSTSGNAMIPSSSIAIATLPVGYRPSRDYAFGAAARWESEFISRIDVAADGSIRLIGVQTLWAGLDDIQFWTD